MLELKKGGRTRVQKEMVKFIALQFPSSKKNLKFGHLLLFCTTNQLSL